MHKSKMRIFYKFLFIGFLSLLYVGGWEGSGISETNADSWEKSDLSLYSSQDLVDLSFAGIGVDQDGGPVYTGKAAKSEVCGPMGTGYNGFSANNCTEWVAVRRCQKNDSPVVWRGNGGEWLTNAKKAGYEIGTAPKAGAIAVFKLSNDPCPNQSTCTNKALFLYGHVAYVESVDNNGWRISEFNWVPLSYGERFFSSGNKATALIGFIYNKQDKIRPNAPTILMIK